MTKSEIRLRIVENFPDSREEDWDTIYYWIMFPDMESERLEKERIEKEKIESIEPSPEE